MHDLTKRRCRSCEGGIPELSTAERAELMAQISDEWQCDGKTINREFQFRNYYQTTAFVNAAAWVAHTEDHHPNTEFGFNKCTVSYSTHAVGGLTENDFICAAKTDALLAHMDDDDLQ